MKKPAVLLMCGGPGTRMRPWSDRRHKCLVGVDGGEPLFAWHLRNIAEAAPGAAVYGNVPEAWLPEYKAVARNVGISVRWVPEGDVLKGSGNRAMEAAERHGVVLVLYGDTWFAPEWYERMRPGYTPFHAVIGVEGLPSDRKDWRGFVRLRRDGGAEVAAGMDERPSRKYRPEQAAFHMGMSVFTAHAAEFVRGDRALESRDDLDLFADVVPAVLRGGLDVAVARGGAYNAGSADLGTPERYAEFIVGRYLGAGAPEGAAEAAVAVARARRVAVAGNGGACCVASHAALDWCKAGRKWTSTFMEPGMLSAWSNDLAFEDAVARQVGMHEWAPDDVLVLLSTSGKSPNILAAARAAKALPGKARPRVVSLTCSEDNPLADIADCQVRVGGVRPKNTWTYGPLEDDMSKWCHAVTAVLEGLAPWPGR